MLRTLRAAPASALVGFDLNGVLCNPNPLLAEEALAQFRVSVDDWSGYDAVARALEAHGVPEARLWIKRRINDPRFIEALAPDPDIQKAWPEIALEKRVVTGHWTRPETMAATEAWVRKHGFGARVDYVAAKKGWVRQTRARCLVEDSPLQALEAAAAGCTVILMDRPYNQEVSHPRIVRATPGTLLEAIQIGP